MKSWRVKFRNFLGNFPVNYADLIINRLLKLYDFIHGLASYSWWILVLLLDSKRALSNYYSYKEKTIKLLPYNSFYGGHIPPRKVDPPFSGSLPQENTKPPRSPFSSIPLKNFKLHLSWSLQHSKLSKYGYYFFSAEHELITCY